MLSTSLKFLTALMCAAKFSYASGAPLDEFKWKNRVIVLLAPAGDSRIAEQKEKLNSKAAAVIERDLRVLEETDSSGPLHRSLKPESKFSVILIGKDGGVKWRSSTVVVPQIIFDKIDSMPMRADVKRDEMRKR